MPTTPLSTNTTINALLSSYQWGTQNGQNVTITYSFPATGAWWLTGYGSEPTTGWFGLTAAQQLNFKSALSTWAKVAGVNFTQVTENQSSVGDIRVAFSNAVKQGGNAGWGYYPTSKSAPQAGDIWLNPDDTDFSQGTQGYHTMMHELGHVLGLKHPFSGSAGNNAVLTGAEDNNQYTIMSYSDYQGAGFVYRSTGPNSYSYFAVQPSTPMLYDIAAIQFLYGANMSTRTGNDSYTFSNTQGEIKTIWDAGGIDTFDLSNQTLNQTINLIAGQFSSLGVKQTAFNGPLSSATANIAIAYNVKIENAIGGAGNDTILGNGLDNALTGGSGNDSLNGGVGNDRINGGAGNDKLVGGVGNDKLNGGPGNDTYGVDTNADSITESAGAGFDTVLSTVSWTLNANVEKLILLGNKLIDGTGNGLNNVMTGNSANNILNGGLGNDKLIGGAGTDTLTGGAGNDVFLLNNTAGADAITDFSVVSDTIQLENAVFSALTSTGILATNQFTFGDHSADTNDYLIYNQIDGHLYYDADGNGATAEIQIATLGVKLALTNADFVVV